MGQKQISLTQLAKFTTFCQATQIQKTDKQFKTLINHFQSKPSNFKCSGLSIIMPIEGLKRAWNSADYFPQKKTGIAMRISLKLWQ